MHETSLITNHVAVSSGFGSGSQGLFSSRIRHNNLVVSWLFMFWYVELLMLKWYDHQGTLCRGWQSSKRAIVHDGSGYCARKRYSQPPCWNLLPEVGNQKMGLRWLSPENYESIRVEFPNSDIRGTPHVTSKISAWKKSYNNHRGILARTRVGFKPYGDFKIDCDDEKWEQIMNVLFLNSLLMSIWFWFMFHFFVVVSWMCNLSVRVGRQPCQVHAAKVLALLGNTEAYFWQGSSTTKYS